MKKILLVTASFALLSACANKSPNTQHNVPEFPEIKPEQAVAPILQPQLQERIVQPDIYYDSFPGTAEVFREGRYTLVNISPEDGQKYLLDQSVTINMLSKKKKALNASVEQGMHATLKNTGLSLCTSYNQKEPTLSILFSRPLPKVHYQFGPMKLREALQMLAGPAYEITLNDITRTVCFKQRSAIPNSIMKGNSPKETVTSTTVTTEIIEE